MSHYYQVLREVAFDAIMTLVWVWMAGNFAVIVYRDFRRLWTHKDEE